MATAFISRLLLSSYNDKDIELTWCKLLLINYSTCTMIHVYIELHVTWCKLQL